MTTPNADKEARFSDLISGRYCYYPDTGRLQNKRTKRYVGRRGTDSFGRIYMRVDIRDENGTMGYFAAHRIAAFLVLGYWPPGQVRFKDKDGTNLKLSNLEFDT